MDRRERKGGTQKVGMLELYNIDCMEYMRDQPDKAFDLAIVDPPYGIGAAEMTMGRGSGNDLGKHQKKNWDCSIPSREYFEELTRVSCNQIIWGGNYFLDFLGKSPCMLVWDKKDYNSDFADGELAWTSFRGGLKIFTRARGSENAHRWKIHPTQKPMRLYQWILTNYAKPGQRILDTHLGSGSSAIAAHYFGVDFVGCEIDEHYFNLAKQRIDQETRQIAMF